MENAFRVVNYRSDRDQVPVLPGEGEKMHGTGWDGGSV